MNDLQCEIYELDDLNYRFGFEFGPKSGVLIGVD